ncbi:putative uncharacterized protein DDB_G0281733 [Trichoplusia ni]|uniref:Uncharacterized protein n=1 Tax=Trichoplusia ni TaxID=7111 RepID=A0A7E5VHI5_TRINI|nr:putative uncharacterized protein DDB_G0281733 [Trichoplusia ni]
MATEITYFILFGLLASSRTSTSYRNSGTNHIEFLKRLEEYYDQDKYDSSRDENSSKSHYSDKYRQPYDDSPSTYSKNNQSEETIFQPFENTAKDDVIKYRAVSKLPHLNAFHEAVTEQGASYNMENAGCMEKWAQCTHVVWKVGKMIEQDSPATVGEVLDFLVEYEKILKDKGEVIAHRPRTYDIPSNDGHTGMKINNKYLLRCKGHGCSFNKDNRQGRDGDDINNAGNRYLRHRHHRHENNKNSLRCVGSECGRNREDRDDNDYNDDRYDRNDNRNRDDNDDDRDDREDQDNRDNRNYRDDQNNRDDRDERDNWDNRYNRDNRDDRNDRDNRDDRDARGNWDNRNDRDSRDDTDERDNRDDQDNQDDRDNRDGQDNRDDWDSRDDQDNRDNRDDRDYNKNGKQGLRCVGNKCETNRDNGISRKEFRCRGDNCITDDESEDVDLSDSIKEHPKIQRLLKDREKLINKLKSLMSN